MKYLLWLMCSLLSLPLCAQQDDIEGGLFLSLNISEGAYLQFNNGKTYEIAPDDRIYTAFWVTPFPAEMGESGDPDYPIQITNLYTGTAVNGKEVSTRELLKKEQERTKSLPPPKETPKQEKEELLKPKKETKTPEKKPVVPKTEKPKFQEAPTQ